MSMSTPMVMSSLLFFAITMSFMGYYLGKSKTRSPFLTSLSMFLLSWIPPLALTYLFVLVLRPNYRRIKQG